MLFDGNFGSFGKFNTVPLASSISLAIEPKPYLNLKPDVHVQSLAAQL